MIALVTLRAPEDGIAWDDDVSEHETENFRTFFCANFPGTKEISPGKK